MSILIRCMEMPETCAKCPICASMPLGDYVVYHKCVLLNRLASKRNRRCDCPLIEVPTLHGRLKDVDVIIKDECHSCDGCCEVIECDCLNCTKAGCDTIRALNDAPTIIEAEE